jgi:hypothetical protein
MITFWCLMSKGEKLRPKQMDQLPLVNFENNRVRKIDQVPKTPPFPIIKILSHKRPNFAMRVFWTNQNSLPAEDPTLPRWSPVQRS